MKKIPSIIIAVALISLGWYLEVYYYWYRFTGDGVDPYVSLSIGGGLTLLLSSLFVGSKKKLFVALPLLLFSIFCTTSGQNFSYNEINNVNSAQTAREENKQQLFDYYTAEISRLNSTIDKKNSVIPSDIQSRANWNTNGVGPLLEEIANLKAEKKEYEEKRGAISLTLTTSKNSGQVNLSAYELFAKDIGLTSSTPVKMVSQIFLSLFIALMAPSGLMIMASTYPKREVVKRVKKEKPAERKPEVKKPAPKMVKTKDIYSVYTAARFGNSDKPVTLKGRTEVCKLTGMSQNHFNKLSKLATDLDLIINSGNKHKPTVNRGQFEMMLRNKQRVGKMEVVG